MPTNGNHLITRIQSMVRVHGRERHKQFAAEFGSVIRRQPIAEKLGDHSDLLFDIFRKCRRDEVSFAQTPELNPGIDSAEDTLWRESREGWGSIGKQELAALYDQTRSEFEAILTEFNGARSRATHVLAIFRPFQERYFSEWVNSIKPYTKEKFEAKITEIRETVVRDKVELAIWANDIFELFQEAAVFYPEKQQIIQKDPNRKGNLPLGMISARSVRIYGQQWRLWVREFEDEILASSEPTSPSARAQDSLSTIATRSSTKFMRIENPVENSINTVSVEVEISPDSDNSLSARRSWTDKQQAIQDVIEWVETTGALWDQTSLPCRASVKLMGSSAETELSLKAADFPSLGALIQRFAKSN